jgi:hypothetical protein
MFFYNIFDTLEQSENANSLAEEFVAGGILKDNIIKVRGSLLFNMLMVSCPG